MRDEITTNNEKSKNYIDFYRLYSKLLLIKMLEVQTPIKKKSCYFNLIGYVTKKKWVVGISENRNFEVIYI